MSTERLAAYLKGFAEALEVYKSTVRLEYAGCNPRPLTEAEASGLNRAIQFAREQPLPRGIVLRARWERILSGLSATRFEVLDRPPPGKNELIPLPTIGGELGIYAICSDRVRLDQSFEALVPLVWWAVHREASMLALIEGLEISRETFAYATSMHLYPREWYLRLASALTLYNARLLTGWRARNSAEETHAMNDCFKQSDRLVVPGLQEFARSPFVRTDAFYLPNGPWKGLVLTQEMVSSLLFGDTLSTITVEHPG